jgi:hypothetical protein
VAVKRRFPGPGPGTEPERELNRQPDLLASEKNTGKARAGYAVYLTFSQSDESACSPRLRQGHNCVDEVTASQAAYDAYASSAKEQEMNRTKLLTLIGMIVCGATAAIHSQAARADDVDPPGRVARVNLVEGSASLQPAGSDQWVSDVLNRPLTTGDKLWVDENARAELHVGSSAMRVGSSTGVEILNIDDRIVQLKLTAGTLTVRVRNLGADQNFEVDTPAVAVTFIRAGEYRLDVSDSGDQTRVATLSGQAAVSGGAVPYTINAGERGEFSGGEQISAQLKPLQGQDDFDRWNERRDQREDESQSARYVSREVTGYEDLDDYGDWRSDPTYGEVWLPRVAIGWAPYHYGHWVWVSPWGWSWIDDAPWGFAPCHYGRWVSLHGAWGWVPGRAIVERPVYAPALVAFVGGAHFSLSVSVGGPPRVGWFPLGYNEMYVPSYRVSNTYVRNVNITNTRITNTYITNNYINNTPTAHAVRYANQAIPGAVTAVPHDAFVSARPVSQNAIRLNAREAAEAPSSTGSLAIAPTRASLGPAPPAGRAPARPTQNVFTRAIVAQHAPPPVVSFEAQRRAIIANGARPVPTRDLSHAEPRPAGAASRPEVRLIRPIRSSPGAVSTESPSRAPQPVASPTIRGNTVAPLSDSIRSRGIDRPTSDHSLRPPGALRGDRPSAAQPPTGAPAASPQPVVPRGIDRGTNYAAPRAPGVTRGDRPPPVGDRAGGVTQGPSVPAPVQVDRSTRVEQPAAPTRITVPAAPTRASSNALPTHATPTAPPPRDRPARAPRQVPAEKSGVESAHKAPKSEQAPTPRRRVEQEQSAQ